MGSCDAVPSPPFHSVPRRGKDLPCMAKARVVRPLINPFLSAPPLPPPPLISPRPSLNNPTGCDADILRANDHSNAWSGANRISTRPEVALEGKRRLVGDADVGGHVCSMAPIHKSDHALIKIDIISSKAFTKRLARITTGFIRLWGRAGDSSAG